MSIEAKRKSSANSNPSPSAASKSLVRSNASQKSSMLSR